MRYVFGGYGFFVEVGVGRVGEGRFILDLYRLGGRGFGVYYFFLEVVGVGWLCLGVSVVRFV